MVGEAPWLVEEPRPRSRSRTERLARPAAILLLLLSAAAIAAGFSSRASYADGLVAAYELEAAGARVLAAGLAEEAVLRSGGDGQGARERRRAARDFDREARRALRLAREDPPSRRILSARVAAQRRARAATASPDALVGEGELTLATLGARQSTRHLAKRQRERRTAARDDAERDTRILLVLAAFSGALAFAAAVATGRIQA